MMRGDITPDASTGANSPVDWSAPLPLRGWFRVAAAHALPPGAVLGFDLPGLRGVVYRGQDGGVRAVHAHCPHMGTDLRHATVVGNALRCPLHHWLWQGGQAEEAGARCLPALPVRLAAGGVWVCTSASSSPPAFPAHEDVADADLLYLEGRPVLLRCPWQAVMANAFDLNHFETVHQRALVDEPVLVEHEDRLDFDYTSRVVGNALADRVMRRISGDRIQVSIKLWHGTVITVRTRTRRRETFLWLCAVPVPGGTEVRPVYAVRRDHPLAFARLRLAGWLFNAFLSKDVQILDGMRFAPVLSQAEDRCLWGYLRFVEKLALRAGGAS